MKRIAYFPGSFDPFTLGHLDVLRQALGVADRVVVAIGVHPGKKPLFTFEERAGMIRRSVGEIEGGQRVEIASFDGLLVDAAGRAGAGLIVRGVRDGSDLDYELQMAGMNGVMAPDLVTAFFAARPQFRFITATLVRQIAAMGGNVSPFVPDAVLEELDKKFKQ